MHVGVVGSEIDDLSQQIVEIGFAQVGTRRTGIVEQILNDLLAAFTLALDLMHVLEFRIILVEFAFQVSRVSENHAERIVDFMSDT